MSQTAPTNLRKVVIQGLQKVEDFEPDDGWSATIGEDSELYNLSLNLREDEQIWPGLWQKIQACGFGMPRKLVHGRFEYEKNYPVTVVREHDEVLVVADDQASTPTTIKMSETLISHTNTHHVSPVEFLADNRSVRCEKTGFSVTFERTTRIPDDNKLHHLPSSLGQYQLFSVDKYSKHLPKNVTETGGVFFSMWQREAMWLNFQPGSRKYVVRVFVGRVNAITGQEMQNEQDAKSEDKLQDYIVIPGQRWLDGICVAPGVVRQFVAMPLGSGYTVEGQKTSEEKHGGLQLEVTPPMEHSKRSWSYAKQQHIAHPLSGHSKIDGLIENRTPRELGCQVGDVLRSYPTDNEFKQSFRVRDLFVQEAQEKGKNEAAQDTDSLSVATVTLKAAGGIWSMPPPIQSNSKHSYYQDYDAPISVNSPFFSLYAPRTGGAYRTRGLDELPPPPEAPPHVPSSAPPQRDSISIRQAQQAPAQQAPPRPQAPRMKAPELPAPVQQAQKAYTTDSPHGPSFHVFDASGDEFKLPDKDKASLMELTEAQAKNVKTLGLAAGGKLIQDIYKDPFPAKTWNHAGARILHVHMLDPESCEKVTHIVPQPPPMAVEDYVKSGGQFYVVEEKVDERLDGGDFDNVKSVSQMDQYLGITTEPEFDPKKPKMCTTCEHRLCDCIIRPCNHQFCNVCIKRLEEASDPEQSVQQANHWKCPTCNNPVSHVAGFSAPMNLPGEERLLRTKVPVHVLKIEDGRARFSSMQTSRI